MHLLRIVTTHPVVIVMMEEAARRNHWASFRSLMLDMDVQCTVLMEPFALLMTMKGDANLVYPAIELVMPIGNSGTPWSANLNSMADYKRVGNHSISWGFDRASHRRMKLAGFNVEE